MRIFIEASGSLVSGYLIKAIKEVNHIVIGSDIDEFNHARYLCDDFVVVPKSNDPDLWKKMEEILLEKQVDIVIPSLDETLLEWAKRKEYFKELGINIVISDPEVIETFCDKWKAYLFFIKNDIPTPKTSLEPTFDLIKPRYGRGGKGIFKKDHRTMETIDMRNYISQEFITGKEYTVDVLFSKDGDPIYIVPRLRLDIRDGKSIKGLTVKNENIENVVHEVSKKIKFIGPINFQFIETDEKKLYLIEINPRIAGGMALGFAATENWIKLIVENIVLGKEIRKENLKPIIYGLRMFRYYDEVFA